jgi:hypothetical protein
MLLITAVREVQIKYHVSRLTYTVNNDYSLYIDLGTVRVNSLSHSTGIWRNMSHSQLQAVFHLAGGTRISDVLPLF